MKFGSMARKILKIRLVIYDLNKIDCNNVVYELTMK